MSQTVRSIRPEAKLRQLAGIAAEQGFCARYVDNGMGCDHVVIMGNSGRVVTVDDWATGDEWHAVLWRSVGAYRRAFENGEPNTFVNLPDLAKGTHPHTVATIYGGLADHWVEVIPS